jgi:hypothetical protein
MVAARRSTGVIQVPQFNHQGGLLMRRSIAVLVAVACVGLSSVVLADDMELGKLSGEMKQDMDGLSNDLNAQKKDLANDLKAKKESVHSEMKAKRDEAKAKKKQAKANMRAKKEHMKAKKEAARAKTSELKGAGEYTLQEAAGMKQDLKDALQN